MSGEIRSGQAFVVTSTQAPTHILQTADLALNNFDQIDNSILQLSNGSNAIDIVGKIGNSTDLTSIDLSLFRTDLSYRESIIFNLGTIQNFGLKRDPIVQSGITNFTNTKLLAEWVLNLENDHSDLGFHSSACLNPVLYWDLPMGIDEYQDLAQENFEIPHFALLRCTEFLSATVIIQIWQNEQDLLWVNGPVGFGPNAKLRIDYDSPMDIEQDVQLFAGDKWNTEIFTPIVDCLKEPDRGAAFILLDVVDDGGTGVVLSQTQGYHGFKIIDVPCTTTSDIVKEDMEIFPVPFNSHIDIKLRKKFVQISKIEIADFTGKKILSRRIEKGGTTRIENLSFLKNGSYILLVYTNEGLHRFKIIKV